MGSIPGFYVAAFYLALVNFYSYAGSGVVGVNYGLNGDNLPPPQQVITLLQSKNITRVRLFKPDHLVLTALRGSGIEVVLGTLNEDLLSLSMNQSYASLWVKNYLVPYSETIKFRCISAGNEVIPSNLAIYVPQAMKNLYLAMEVYKIDQVPVSTAVSTAVLGTSYPPSAGEFSSDVKAVMSEIASFLTATEGPLLLNVYPYFAYISDPAQINLSYALFNSTEVVVRDGTLCYENLYDAMVDAAYSALEKVGAESINVVVSETGWPSDGDGNNYATVWNAQMYNKGLAKHVLNGTGTPRRPDMGMEAFIFAIFNENMKPPGTEQHFGLYYPNMTEVYHININR